MRSTRYALVVAAGYVTLAGLYIATSSAAAARWSSSVSELASIEEVKGVIFVLVTGVVVFLSSRFALSRIEAVDRELLLRERALVSSDRRVLAGLLASTVAHDANNVLLVLMGELALLESAPEEAPAAIARMQKSVDSLVALNRRLLQLVRQRAEAVFERLELGASVEEALETVRLHPAMRAVTVEVERPRQVEILGQRGLVAQIVGNLVVNAAEASGGRGTVWVAVEARGHEGVIEVHDAGPGVPPERRARLFDSLESTKPDGNGMGLFSVKACALGLDGRVEVDASPRGGACFRVWLPLDGAPRAGGRQFAAARAPGT